MCWQTQLAGVRDQGNTEFNPQELTKPSSAFSTSEGKGNWIDNLLLPF